MFKHIADTSFYKNIFDKNIFGTKGFPSILEISTQALDTSNISLDDDTIEDEQIWEKLNNQNKDKLKIHHKYIAIVQADGDSIGEIIKQIAKDGSKKIKEFSKALSSFSLLAAQEIANYKGVPVYTGGDDLLFFAPVANGTENIFSLIKKLDDIFDDQVKKKFNETKPQASMSYGVSISYYKYPMHEALNTARDLLFNKAKQKPKNAIAFKVLKHSGQVFEAIMHKPLDNKFKKLLKEDKGLVINSLIYKFDKHKILLEESLKAKTNAKLENFFDNFYNEDIHNESRVFINNVKDLLQEVYTNNKDFTKTINQVSAQLRFVKFLNATKDD
jgi:CRISPR-associated protein Cmr2